MVAYVQSCCHGNCKEVLCLMVDVSANASIGVEWCQWCSRWSMCLRNASRHLSWDCYYSKHYGKGLSLDNWWYDWICCVLDCHLLLFGHSNSQDESVGLCETYCFHHLGPVYGGLGKNFLDENVGPYTDHMIDSFYGWWSWSCCKTGFNCSWN